MSILSLPSEMLVEIATYLDTTRNLANFKMTCSRIYNAVESEKVDRKRLPQLKIQCISFSENGHSQIEVDYSYENEVDCLSKKRDWDYSDPSSPRLQILIQHWSLEDSCEMDFAGHCILEIPLLESLLEINYGNEIQCQLNNGGSLKLANPGKFKEALPLVQDFFRKVCIEFPVVSCNFIFTTLQTWCTTLRPVPPTVNALIKQQGLYFFD